MDDGEQAGLRELVARGRAHYEDGEYAEADGLLHRGAAREGALRRRLRHAGRHLSPGGAPGGGGADVQRSAAHQPGLHRGGAEPGRDLQRPGQVRRGEDGLREGDGDVQARAARAGSVRQGKDRQHARRHRVRVPRRLAVRGGGARIRAGARALSDVRRHPHRARQHPPRDGGHDGRDPRAGTGARREPALRGGPPEAGPRLLRGGATRGRRR